MKFGIPNGGSMPGSCRCQLGHLGDFQVTLFPGYEPSESYDAI